MGNAILSRGHGRVKLMKLDGQVVKIKAPVTVDEVLRDYPGHVLLHSEAVRHMGVRAKPLDGNLHLNPKHLYFVVRLPKLEDYYNTPRRVRSGITLNAKSRLENLLLARRSVSDISIMASSNRNDASSCSEKGEEKGAVRVKLRLPKAQLVQMMSESADSDETAKKLLDLALSPEKTKEEEDGGKYGITPPWKPALGRIPESSKCTTAN